VADPWQFWDAATIARITGSPVDAVTRNWPLIADALERRGIYERNVCLGLLATVAIETASTFEPIDEFPDPRRYPDSGGYPPHYEGGPDYHGRGFLQVTHLGNYRQAGAVVGRDLVADPSLANDPKIAAEILAWWFATKGVPSKDGSRFYSLVDLCRERDWEWVRRAVQGGTAGLDRLIAIASALDAYAAPGGGAMPVKFDPHYPAVIQNDDWSCAPTSLTWAMKALGRHPGDNFIEDDMVRLGLVTHEQGLMNHTGSGIVTWLQIGDAQHYGSDGYGISNNQNPISWDVLVPEITPYPPYPLLLGLPNWGGLGKGHWSGVRGYDPGRGVILLANPDTGTTYGHAALTRQQFEARAGGNASIVRVLHPDLLGATPEPPKPPVLAVTRADLDPIIAQSEAVTAALRTLRERAPA
jgi:hypothetical protein